MFFIKQKKGIALYFTLTILSVLTAALLATMTIIISQTKIIFSMGDSISAFYAADAGAEDVLYRIYQDGYTPVAEYCFPGEDLGETEYQVCISSVSNKIWSEGTSKKSNTKRKIELEIRF